ncbi:uncharacterized protein LOC119320324 [Triticum dicoccoides]|uniref:uncharacterized protein LOC119320324 n=1 Tax=Triticum dicoccoides TaxID=85692 RepID=UPI001890C846|nr:uncharacterized protein LOC119320324 [Triticum dicoccoides]
METAAASRSSGPVLSTSNCRSASPTPVKLAGGSATHSPGPGKSVSGSSPSSTRSRRFCTCSPTNHPGSFRCSLHKARKQAAPAGSSKPASPPSTRGPGSKRMNSRQCARRALAPSAAAQQSQHLRRAGGLIPRTSRLSAMSMAGERPGDKLYFISLVVEVSVDFLVWLWNLARGI